MPAHRQIADADDRALERAHRQPTQPVQKIAAADGQSVCQRQRQQRKPGDFSGEACALPGAANRRAAHGNNTKNRPIGRSLLTSNIFLQIAPG